MGNKITVLFGHFPKNVVTMGISNKCVVVALSGALIYKILYNFIII